MRFFMWTDSDLALNRRSLLLTFESKFLQPIEPELTQLCE